MKTCLNRSHIALAISLPIALLFPNGSFAGNGKMTQPDPNGPVHVTTTVHIAFPPTQTQIDDIKGKLRKAARMICDATDGQVLIDDIRLERNGLSADRADVIWFPDHQISRFIASTGGMHYGHPVSHFRVANHAAFRAVAHEFGHLLFGLRDQYDRQRRFGGACGIGLSIEESLITDTNHSIMQAYQTYCWSALNGYREECDDDEPCNDMLGEVCYEFTDTASEFNGPSGFETVRGDAAPWPGVQAGEKLWLDTRLYVDLTTDWTIANRSIEFIDEVGELDLGSSHRIWLKARKIALHTYELEAFMGPDTNTLAQLSWTFDGSTTNTLTLEFDPNSAGCGQVPDPNNYDLVEINGNTSWSVTLGITNAQLVADYEVAADYTGSGNPVQLDVDFGNACERDISGYVDLVVESPDVELVTGFGLGTYIGRTAPITSPAQGAPSSEPVYQQLGVCTDSNLDDRWNGERQRWETSDQYLYTQALWDNEVECANPGDPDCVLGAGSDWELMAYNLGYKWNDRWPQDFDALNISQPSPIVAAPGPSGCVNFEPVIDTTKIEAVNTIALLIDRSGSMKDTWQNGASTKRKIDWARKGASGFALAGEDQGLSLALAAFNDEILELGSPTPVTLTATPPPRISAAGVELLADLEPTGSTAIGDAVVHAVTEMLPNPFTANAVFLLSDGESNAGISIAAASDIAKGADIPVFISPVGTFDASELQGLANATGGQLLPTLEADEIPATMFAMRAKMRGEDLSMVYEESTLSKSDPQYLDYVEYDIIVETGAERLVMLLTPSAEYFDSWAVSFVLSGPQGESITQTSVNNVAEDPDGFFYLISVPNPSPGTWTMKLEAPPPASEQFNPEAQLLMAHVEHEGPRCRVNTSDTLINDTTKEVTVFAEADWTGVVGEGVEFFGEVERPNGSTMVFTLTQQPNGLASGVFSGYSYDGTYRVKVRCEVAADATYARGEGEDYGLPAQPVPGEFERTGMSYFVLDADLPLPLTDYQCQASDRDYDSDGAPDRCDSDKDNDDLPNSEEAPGDTDGDGNGNWWDRDSDDDGDFDGEDWDAVDPYSHRRYTQGDFNGDGLDDLAWGEPDYGSGRGRIMVKYVGEDDPEPWHQDTAGILGVAEPNEYFGAAVAAGDFDGDGYDDVAIGVPSQGFSGLTDPGVVQIIYGSSSGLTSTGDQSWSGDSSGIVGVAENGNQFGARLSTGDFDCDGYLDLVIGTPDEDVGSNDEAGAVHVLYGSAGGVSAVNDLWYQGDSGVNGSSEAGDRFGDELATGDFNGDTCQDLVIGAPFEDYGLEIDSGNAYVIYGTPSGLSTTGDWTLIQGVLQHPIEANDNFATRLWADFRGADQYEDLVIMNPGDCASSGFKGFNYLYGSASGLTTTDNVWFCREYK